jgi:hypothetical protein
MALEKITNDLAVLKSNTTFNASFTTSLSGNTTISYGDGNEETTNSPSHVYSSLPPYIINTKTLDDDSITGITISGGNITACSISQYENLNNFVLDVTSMPLTEVENIFIDLDENNISNGNISIIGYDGSPISSEATTAYGNLVNKGWNVEGGFWTPSVLSTLAWYDGSDANTITLDGSNVTQWSDKSGNGYDLSQGTVNDQPTYGGTINGLGAVEFADRTIVSLSQDISTTTNLAQFEYVIMVLNRTYGDAFSQALGSQSGAGGNNYTVQYRGDVATNKWQNAYYTDGNPLSSTGADALYNDACIVVHDNLSLTDFPLMVGGDRGINSRGWDGFIGEIICGSETLTTELRQTLEGYLAHKWGSVSSLPSDHPYKNNAP